MRWLALPLLLMASAVAPAAAAAERPSVLLVTIDTLRADRVSSYGHLRQTTPSIDALLAAGRRFTNARTVEPLTAPAFASMLTSLHPHGHGLTRNGLAARSNLVSFAGLMGRRGYRTAAFVGNWTLRDELSGFGEYFDVYETVLTRKRWFGLYKREATADDVNAAALDWLAEHRASEPGRPWLLWVHYTEPHAPYRLQREYLDQLGLKASGSFFAPSKRYDSEVAFADDRLGRLLAQVEKADPGGDRLTVFLSDHGESLGDHGYWGHGRHLYEDTLWIPLGFTWPGRIAPGAVEAPASILDVSPTLLGLVGLPAPPHFRGFDWSGVLLDGAEPPEGRVTLHQAHRAAVEPQEDNTRLRRRGLLEVARVAGGRKEVFRPAKRRRWVHDLVEDPDELSEPLRQAEPSPELARWLAEVREGLAAADDLPPPTLTDEDIQALRALGYLD